MEEKIDERMETTDRFFNAIRTASFAKNVLRYGYESWTLNNRTRSLDGSSIYYSKTGVG